jgi:hypothetical protein
VPEEKTRGAPFVQPLFSEKSFSENSGRAQPMMERQPPGVTHGSHAICDCVRSFLAYDLGQAA